ncbi:Wd repeat-containing protein [Thalictrum thalictroides]|uniref:Wd repeat-containing protein n=1 Tax=Thalictrum thalictroides TaxID=46969 RepID=A0A7J6URU4_THATH|nr:Wd repeat-containing protein [Thalictrum thalictroides]
MSSKENDEVEEIVEKKNDETSSPTPKPKSSNRSKSVKTKVPEAEVHVYRRGQGPIEIFKSSLGGWDQDQLEVVDIMEKYGFKSVFAFNPGSGRGVPIRFAKNGRSVLTYKDGSVVHIDGEPKDSLLSPITKILIGVVVMTILISLALKETPTWMKSLNIPGFNFSPWMIACVVIVFTRWRKRTRDLLKKFGW